MEARRRAGRANVFRIVQNRWIGRPSRPSPTFEVRQFPRGRPRGRVPREPALERKTAEGSTMTKKRRRKSMREVTLSCNVTSVDSVEGEPVHAGCERSQSRGCLPQWPRATWHDPSPNPRCAQGEIQRLGRRLLNDLRISSMFGRSLSQGISRTPSCLGDGGSRAELADGRANCWNNGRIANRSVTFVPAEFTCRDPS